MKSTSPMEYLGGLRPSIEGDWLLLLSPAWVGRTGDYPRTLSAFIALGSDEDVPFTVRPTLLVLSSERPKRFGVEVWLSWFGICAGVRVDVRRPGGLDG